MKFPKNNPKNRKINDFKTTPISRWNRWERMIKDYETNNSAIYDVYKEEIPKFKINRPPVTFEKDVDTIFTEGIENSPTTHKNDDIIQNIMTNLEEKQTHIDIINTAPRIEIKIPEIVNKVKLKTVEDETFYLPKEILLNNKTTSPFLPHIKGTISADGDTTQVSSYLLDDTGASNCLVSTKWLKKYFPNCTIRVSDKSFTTCGKIRQGITGVVTLHLTLKQEDGQTVTITDDFYIANNIGNIELIMGRTILGNPKVYKGQNLKYIKFYKTNPSYQTVTPAAANKEATGPKSDTVIQIPILNMHSSQQNSKIVVNNMEMVNRPLPSTILITPTQTTIIRAHDTKTITCILPEISKVDAPQWHGKTIILTATEMETNQQRFTPTTEEAISICKIDEIGRVTCTANVHNPSNINVTISENNIIGHGTIIEKPNIGTLTFEQYNESKDLLEELTREEMAQIRDEINKRLDNESVECNNSETANPIIIPLNDTFEKRERRLQNKANWRPEQNQNITDDLNLTELRPDLLETEIDPPDKTEEEFLKQFDIGHMEENIGKLFKNSFIETRDNFAKSPTDIGKTSLLQMELPTKPGKAFQKQRILSPEKLKFLKPVIDMYLEKDIIEV